MTIAAWVRPVELSGFREILRQECDERVLFSFQNDGTVLSLGLNVNGYVECDASIDPAQVLDGMWHHCAATFDGQALRVYFDGKQIGILLRPGEIALSNSAPMFIGSSGGQSEYFLGGLDELRLEAKALEAAQIARLYEAGRSVLEKQFGELSILGDQRYHRGSSFAESLANTHRQLAEHGELDDREIVGLLMRRLQADFPAECASYAACTGSSLMAYMTSSSAAHRDYARHLIELLIEYKPLTPAQWDAQAPEAHAHWESVREIELRFAELKALGDAAEYSPEWVELAMAAGRRVKWRPTVSEAVAPFVPPNTPRTSDLSAQAARELLCRDWLYQVDDDPSIVKIQREIVWARELAARLLATGSQDLDLTKHLTELDALESQAGAAKDVDEKGGDAELYFRVREVKRAIAFANPVIDFRKLLFVDMPLPQGSEWNHETRHRLGYMAVPGARLLVLDGLSPAGRLMQLMPQPPLHGSFWRPDLSYDGTRVLFCFKPHNEKSFHLYEIGVDGTGLVQLTHGPYDDLDPIYLPDNEHLMFSTTRGRTYVRCMPPTNAFVLARSDRDGKNIYLISRNNEPDYLPSVLNDGRVVYTRWEYTDKPLWRAQSLWTVHPDGTHVANLWGNQSVWPDLLKDARSIPGSQRVMFTGSAHHNWFSGAVGIIDPEQGFNFPDGLTKVTAELPWPECGNGPADPIESPRYHASGQYAAYYSPYPLSERDFLVSANRNGKFVLYWMDVDGNRELIYEAAHHILHAMPIRARRRPAVISDRVAWPKRGDESSPERGVIYTSNVYEGLPSEVMGKAKFLQILAIDPKTYTNWNHRPYISTGPVVSIVQSDGVKRVIGTVPIEVDGSTSFYAPAGKALHFQLLDEEYRALMTMRSFTGVMPGEHRGCVGCHASHSRAPEHYASTPIAFLHPPHTITPPPWGEDTVSYLRYVQPILDQYCGECHQGDGGAKAILDLTLRPGYLMFNEPYVTLTGKPTWGQPYKQPDPVPPGWGIADMLMVEAYDQRDPAAYQTPPPMTHLSYRSRLIELASSGKHHNVRVDPTSLRKLMAWVDTMCPYFGDEEIRQLPDPEFQGIDWLSIRPLIKSAPRVIRPGPID
jgi:hypothetical protein